MTILELRPLSKKTREMLCSAATFFGVRRLVAAL
jgi:hypothetical protein